MAKSINEQPEADVTFRDPDRAFNEAIEPGWLSSKPAKRNYAGDFMYMFTRNGCDYFKHVETRRYFRCVNPDPVAAEKTGD